MTDAKLSEIAAAHDRVVGAVDDLLRRTAADCRSLWRVVMENTRSEETLSALRAIVDCESAVKRELAETAYAEINRVTQEIES